LTPRRILTGPPKGSTEPGAESDIYDCLVLSAAQIILRSSFFLKIRPYEWYEVQRSACLYGCKHICSALAYLKNYMSSVHSKVHKISVYVTCYCTWLSFLLTRTQYDTLCICFVNDSMFSRIFVHRTIHSLCLKKQDTKLLPITSANVNRFSKFFHW